MQKSGQGQGQGFCSKSNPEDKEEGVENNLFLNTKKTFFFNPKQFIEIKKIHRNHAIIFFLFKF